MKGQSELTARFVGNVRRLRTEMRLIAENLVSKVNASGEVMSRPTLTNLENRRRDHVTLDEAYALAAALGTNVEHLAFSTGPRCNSCLDQPPAGYTCNACGATEEPS